MIHKLQYWPKEYKSIERERRFLQIPGEKNKTSCPFDVEKIVGGIPREIIDNDTTTNFEVNSEDLIAIREKIRLKHYSSRFLTEKRKLRGDNLYHIFEGRILIMPYSGPTLPENEDKMNYDDEYIKEAQRELKKRNGSMRVLRLSSFVRAYPTDPSIILLGEKKEELEALAQRFELPLRNDQTVQGELTEKIN